MTELEALRKENGRFRFELKLLKDSMAAQLAEKLREEIKVLNMENEKLLRDIKVLRENGE